MSKSRGLNRSTMFNILHPSLAQTRYESQRLNLRERCGTIRPVCSGKGQSLHALNVDGPLSAARSLRVHQHAPLQEKW